MRKFYTNQICQVVLLVAIGLVINRIMVELALYFELPLYLDCIGTIYAAALGGLCPAALVGFLTNFIGGLSDSSTFYYGAINVMIAVLAGIAVKHGAFDKIYRLPKLLGLLMLLSIPCSIFTYFLFNFEIGQNVVTPVANALQAKGLPILLCQILADYTTEIPDKTISILAAFALFKLTPQKIYNAYDSVSGRLHEKRYRNLWCWCSLKSQTVALLFLSSFASAVVATVVAYKAYSEAEIREATLLANSVNHLVADAVFNADSVTLENYIRELENEHPQILRIKLGVYKPSEGAISVVCTQTPRSVCTEFSLPVIRATVILFCTKIFSTLFGLLLCVVFAAIFVANRRVVYPIYEITEEMENFGYDSLVDRKKSIERIRSIEVKTNNEIEHLYLAIVKAVKEIDHYIDMSEKQTKSIAAMQTNTITTLSDLVENRDENTGGHVKRTAAYAKIIAKQLFKDGLEKDVVDRKFISTIFVAAPLHDIGKIRVSDIILNKPGKLTSEEFELMKLHSVFGKEILEKASENMGETAYLRMARDIAFGHHEWFDGTRGYPEHLKGCDIPLSARIMAVADVFDALVSSRPYKKPLTIDEAFAMISAERGTHFDPEIVDEFIKNRRLIERVMRAKK